MAENARFNAPTRRARGHLSRKTGHAPVRFCSVSCPSQHIQRKDTKPCTTKSSRLPARTIVGPTVRTSNNSPEETTVIGQLWQRFMARALIVPSPRCASKPYGCFALYYGYDTSDMSYELLVGCEVFPPKAPEGMEAQDHRRRPLREDRYPRRRLRDQRPESLGGDLGRRGAGAQRAFTVDFGGVPARQRTCPAPTSTCS